MHGRIALIAAALAAAVIIAAPTAARAGQPTFTPACAGNWNCIGLDVPSPYDGVITTWRIRSATAQTVALRSVQPRDGGQPALVTATSDPITLAAGELRTVTARLPIAEDGLLELVGATGTPEFEAELAGDLDGDGFVGTDDICSADVNRQAEPCTGVHTFGSPLVLQPAPGGFPASGASTDALQTQGGLLMTAPVDGVITRWRVRSATTAPLTLQVLHPQGSAYLATRASAPAAPAPGGAITTIDGVRLPVAAGDRLGLRADGDLGAVAWMLSGEHVALLAPPLGVGASGTPGAELYGFRLLVQADVEPDGDHDGFGDLTQDGCPFDTARQAGCQADLAVVPYRINPGIAPVDRHAFFEFTLENRGPDPARDVTLRFTVPPGTVVDGNVAPGCGAVPGGVAECRIARLDPGASETHRFYVEGAVPGISSTVTATSATPDPDPSNNTRTLTAVAPTLSGSIGTIQLGAAILPCGELRRGTRKADTLRGTDAGDHLVGGDGRDVLRGLDGDDCLEGGNGDDRLDGGQGDDELSGGKGSDRLIGGPGKDTISPGAGRDTVLAGTGNDTISAADGVRETIDCGPGKDTVRADRRDRLKHCEKVTRRR
jgi:hypothetical protein